MILLNPAFDTITYEDFGVIGAFRVECCGAYRDTCRMLRGVSGYLLVNRDMRRLFLKWIPTPGSDSWRVPTPGELRLRASSDSGRAPTPGELRLWASSDSGRAPTLGELRLRASSDSGRAPTPGELRLWASSDSGRAPTPGELRLRGPTPTSADTQWLARTPTSGVLRYRAFRPVRAGPVSNLRRLPGR